MITSSKGPGAAAPVGGLPLTGTPLTLRNIFIATGFSVLYLILSALLIGFKKDQLFLVGLFNVLFYLSGPTRRFILGFTVFIVFWVIFDFMKAFPNFRYNTVHIGSLYNAEKSLFGVGTPGGVSTPNEYWRVHQHTFLDILAGGFFFCLGPVSPGGGG